MNKHKTFHNNEKISIVIVNWNGKKWLKKCLDSIDTQTYEKTETIIIDNASNDGSVEYIKKNYPKVKIYINKINMGLPRAINRGVRKSTGKYLLLLNNDVWVSRDFIEKLHSFYLNNDYSVIAPHERRYNKSSAFKNNTTIDPTGSPAYFPTLNKNKPLFLSVCYFLTKEEYLNTLGFDNDYFAYYEDVDWFWRIALLGKSISYAENIFVYHEGAGSIGRGIKYKMFLWRNQNALQTLLKNYSSPTLILIIPLYLLQNLFEIMFCLIILKPNLAYSYIQGWLFNIKNLKKIRKKRHWIQSRRVVSDLDIFKRMYLGPAKLAMLINYLR